MGFRIESPAFRQGTSIPRKQTCDGADVSPALRWSEAPPGTRVFALVCDDPDAPGGTWVHWVVYGIPATAAELGEGVPPSPRLADGSKQGTNDFRKVGYGGPCPPRGKPHRYSFRLYALSADPGLGPGASKEQLMRAVEGKVLGQAELVGTYGRA